MARGTPDYNPSSSQYGQQLTDVAELAARLGSLDTYERKGSVFYMDDFRGLGSGWQPFSYGSGVVSYITDHVFSGSCALKILPTTPYGDYTLVSKRFPIIDLSKVGYEIMVSSYSDDVHAISDFVFAYKYYTGSTVYVFAIQYQQSTNKLYLWTGNVYPPEMVAITGDLGKIYVGGVAIFYNYFKMVVDLDTLTYDRFIWNNQGGTLRQYTPEIRSNTTTEHLEVYMHADASYSNMPVYFSNLVLTMDEP